MIPETNLEADIVKFTRLYQLPTAAQLEAGLDMNNYKPLKSGSKDLKANEYADLVIEGLQQDTVYVIFASLSKNDGGSMRYSLKEETMQIVIKTLRMDFVT
jgi:hypothetical protein